VATSLVGIPVLVVVAWFGFPWLMLAVLAVTLSALVELYRLGIKAGVRLLLGPGLVAAIAIVLTIQFRNDLQMYLLPLIPAAVLIVALLAAIARAGRRAFLDWSLTVSAVLYVALLLSHLLLLRDVGEDAEGRNWVVFALITTFATDTGAFFTGTAIGRHKMAPHVSPRKTWEGALGGFVWAVGVALVLGVAMKLPVAAWQQALLGVAVGVVGQAGDLLESRIKRAAHAKEAGVLVPGHGGVMDRLDSVLFTVPVIYYLVVFAFGR
jgi:phosphatidate cytidylyltransferase